MLHGTAIGQHRNYSSDEQVRLTALAEELAEQFFAISGVVGFVIGGSLARGLVDKFSDLEAYCYYRDRIPEKSEIQGILDGLNAETVRSSDLHWSHPAWGTHTFFRARGDVVELGYRNVDEVEAKVDAYLSGIRIHTTMGDHDVPFGHYPSGLASCLVDCRIVIERDNEVTRLKERAGQFPDALRRALLDFHALEASGILRNKLTIASQRSDLLHFQAALARVIRSIVIVMFTLNAVHFPGDKWNVNYMRRMTMLPDGFLDDLDGLLSRGLVRVDDRRRTVGTVQCWVDWIEQVR
jgi:Domain of unknown function (DUF4037)